MPYINEPAKKTFILKLLIWISERKVGKRMDVARLLAWFPKAAISSGVVELLVAHKSGRLTERVLQLIRMQVSFLSSCAFCIDMNAHEFRKHGITDDEILALQGTKRLESVSTFSRQEKLALRYTRALTRTPIRIDEVLLREVLDLFTEKELVIIVTTVGQVNYWTRTIQGLGIPPAGFSTECSILNIDTYETLRGKNTAKEPESGSVV